MSTTQKVKDVGTDMAPVPSAAPIVVPAGRGKTFVADSVISTIARIAAEQVEGVHQIGVTGLKGLVQRIGSGGIEAEVGMKQAAVSLDIVVEYGFPIREVATELRSAVIAAVEHMADRSVVAVDINVVDIFLSKQELSTSRALV